MYVATSPDTMPSTRIYDGNLLTLMLVLDKLKGWMGDNESTLYAILKAVNMTSDKSGYAQSPLAAGLEKN